MTRGSKPGERRGGRRKGTPNKATTERRLRTETGLAAARQSGVMPLDVILARMRDETLPNGRKPSDEQFQAAIAAAPYLHPKLAAIAVDNVRPPDPVLTEQQEEARRLLFAHLEAMAVPEPLELEGTVESPSRTSDPYR
jgi:hypothetical protein